MLSPAHWNLNDYIGLAYSLVSCGLWQIISAVNATCPSPLFPKTSYEPVCNNDLTDFDIVDGIGADVGVVNAKHWLLSVCVEVGT
ncbi:hypothetical protein DFS33DRAFT_762120 [Desarmillaria ectypa]|nr:hypothetical protein DFS33DRAFT_762120 [Desarmillaria ectypa]